MTQRKSNTELRRIEVNLVELSFDLSLLAKRKAERVKPAIRASDRQTPKLPTFHPPQSMGDLGARSSEIALLLLDCQRLTEVWQLFLNMG